MSFFNSNQTLDGVAVFQMLSPLSIVLGENMRRTVVSEELIDLQKSIDSLREMGEGIEGSGILQALWVRPLVQYEEDSCFDSNGLYAHELKANSGPQYQLICGQKRFLAAKALALSAVPCLIDHRDIATLAEKRKGSLESLTRLLQLTENLQRSDPPPLEEAEALLATMKEMRLSVRDAARLLGKNKGYIENRLRLLKMVPDVQRMVSLRKDTIPHAYYICQIIDEELRTKLISAVLHEQIGVREVRRRIEAECSELADKLAGESEGSASTNLASNATQVSEVKGTDYQANEETGAANNLVSAEGNGLPAVGSSSPLSPGRDYLRQNLRPAVSLVAQAISYINAQEMTETQRKNIYVELSLLRRQIEVLEDRLKS